MTNSSFCFFFPLVFFFSQTIIIINPRSLSFDDFLCCSLLDVSFFSRTLSAIVREIAVLLPKFVSLFAVVEISMAVRFAFALFDSVLAGDEYRRDYCNFVERIEIDSLEALPWSHGHIICVKRLRRICRIRCYVFNYTFDSEPPLLRKG
jgi:hypothetical protein